MFDPCSTMSLAQGEERAYLLLEAARLCCEGLSSRGETAIAASTLEDVHREVGLAGFFASTNLAPELRRAALARARHGSPCNDIGAPRCDRGLVAAVERARRAVEAGLIAPCLSDHMHLAHVHVLSAEDLLSSGFVADTPAVEVRAQAADAARASRFPARRTRRADRQ